MAAPAKSGEYNPNDPTEEMFPAIEKGDIAVQLIFKDRRSVGCGLRTRPTSR